MYGMYIYEGAFSLLSVFFFNDAFFQLSVSFIKTAI